MFSAREVQEDAKDAEGEPEVKVRVGEGEGQDHADERDRFAEGAGHDEAGLDVLYVLLGDGLFERTPSHEKG